MLKDKKAFIFFFLMTVIFLDFARQLKKISFNSIIENINNPIFQIVHVNNSGGAFGIFENSALILAILGLVAVSYITGYVFKHVCFSDKLILLSSALFCAGTLGNVTERLKYGYVIDYIKLNFVDFPVFNSYDILICVGIIIYFIYIVLSYKKGDYDSN